MPRKCGNCQKVGHYRSTCPLTKKRKVVVPSIKKQKRKKSPKKSPKKLPKKLPKKFNVTG